MTLANDRIHRLQLISAIGTQGTGDIGGTVSFATFGSVNNGAVSIDPAAPVANLLDIGGWTLDLMSLNIVDQTAQILTMEGTGVITGNGFDSTAAMWTFSAQSTGSSYSMTVEAIKSVTEPGILSLCLAGLTVLWWRRRLTR